jgi:hypothetical protein
MLYRVLYDAPDGVRSYTVYSMPRVEAERQLTNFQSRYLNLDGTGKQYPNGLGFYPFSNARIEEAP